MIKITKEKYDSIHSDYKGMTEAGERSVLSGSIGEPIGSLLIEGKQFEIVANEYTIKHQPDIYEVLCYWGYKNGRQYTENYEMLQDLIDEYPQFEGVEIEA